MKSQSILHRHHWANQLQTGLLVLLLLGIGGLTGSLLLGELGFWLAAGGVVFVLLFEPIAAWRLTLQLYRAQRIYPTEAPTLWHIVQTLSERAALPNAPVLYLVPSNVINAFAVGNRKHSAIALSYGLLSQLSQRELVGVLGHEIAHIVHGDLKVLGLADYVSRLTNLFSLVGQLMVVLSLPLLFIKGVQVQFNLVALLILIFSPHLAILAQLGLSRVREYNADLKAAALTGDPIGLAYALVRIETVSRSWLAVVLPGWGNPQPSWLRSHPPTQERISRLQQYAQSNTSQHILSVADMPFAPEAQLSKRAPRWQIGGLWH